MKLNKHQKDIIKHIKTKDIYDLYSYIKFYNLGEYVKYDRQTLQLAFDKEDICKDYYYPKTLRPKASNVLNAKTFQSKLAAGIIDKEKYNSFSLSLGLNSGMKRIQIGKSTITIDLYEGIYIAKSFESIIEFLTLWQYLKSEMLILEVSADLSPNNMGLFFEKMTNSETSKTLSEKDILKNINYENFTFNDTYFLNENMYSFSNENYVICKDFLTKRIYPTPALNKYIKCKFKTTEQIMQSNALLAAWLAIFVSIFLAFVPYIYSHSNTDNTINGSYDTTDSVSSNP